MSLIPFSEIKELAPGASTEQTISVTFVNATQPAKFEILYVPRSLQYSCLSLPSLPLVWCRANYFILFYQTWKGNTHSVIGTLHWRPCITCRADPAGVYWAPKYEIFFFLFFSSSYWRGNTAHDTQLFILQKSLAACTRALIPYPWLKTTRRMLCEMSSQLPMSLMYP